MMSLINVTDLTDRKLYDWRQLLQRRVVILNNIFINVLSTVFSVFVVYSIHVVGNEMKWSTFLCSTLYIRNEQLYMHVTLCVSF